MTRISEAEKCVKGALAAEAENNMQRARELLLSAATLLYAEINDPKSVYASHGPYQLEMKQRCDEYVERAESLCETNPRRQQQPQHKSLGVVEAVAWEDVVGLDTAKRVVEEAIFLPRRCPNLFKGKVRKPWSTILLYGPPGTGKTYFGKAIATRANCTFVPLEPSDIYHKYLGESEAYVRKIFEDARAQAPSILFIDEADFLFGRRGEQGEHEASRRIKTQLMEEIQRIIDSPSCDILILAATNRPFELDSAFQRRFQKRIHIRLPDHAARKTLLMRLLDGESHDLTATQMDQLADETEGYSNAEINTIIKGACFAALGPVRDATHFERIDNVLRPCSPTAERDVTRDVIRMQWNDMPEELAAQIEAAPTSLVDFRAAVRCTQPAVTRDEVTRLEVYEKEGV